MTKVIWRRQSIFASSISLNHLQSVLLLLPVGASTKGSGCPEGRRLPVIVGVREAVEVAAVPIQLGHASVVLLRPPLLPVLHPPELLLLPLHPPPQPRQFETLLSGSQRRGVPLPFVGAHVALALDRVGRDTRPPAGERLLVDRLGIRRARAAQSVPERSVASKMFPNFFELQELGSKAADLLVDHDPRRTPLVPVAVHRAAAVHLGGEQNRL